MNRGSRLRVSLPWMAGLSFNEAPIHESGKSRPDHGSHSAARGFNEAPIHESGKCLLGTLHGACPRGFNEAPIHESGKCKWVKLVKQTGKARFNEAPIHESGKSRRSWRASSRSDSASFNEAPIHESGKSTAASAPGWDSQCFNEAPIHESGKSTPSGLACQRRCVASMRPRFMNRGSDSHVHERPRHLHASMRPRFMNRGSAAAYEGLEMGEQRCFNEAPIHESGKSSYAVYNLLRQIALQ